MANPLINYAKALRHVATAGGSASAALRAAVPAQDSREDLIERSRPSDLSRARCRVKLVCGPPAAGKSTYVKAYAAPTDIVIDLDVIAFERGLSRDRSNDQVSALLHERNRRLAALAEASPDAVAWVVLTAPSCSLRAWWCKVLGVQPVDLILLVPPRQEIRRRILNDPDRHRVRHTHLELVDQWFARERRDDPGMVSGRVGADSMPLDPLHPVNRIKIGEERK